MNYKDLHKRFGDLKRDLDKQNLLSKGNYQGVFNAIERSLAKLAGLEVKRADAGAKR